MSSSLSSGSSSEVSREETVREPSPGEGGKTRNVIEPALRSYCRDRSSPRELDWQGGRERIVLSG